jgi:beta-N-acetylhexosaminidase
LAQHAAEADLIIVTTKNAHLHAEQATLVRRLMELNRRVVGIAVHNPYDLLAFPHVATYLATYEYTQPAMEAVAGVLWGEFGPQGHLPVSLPGLYPSGHGDTFGDTAK